MCRPEDNLDCWSLLSTFLSTTTLSRLTSELPRTRQSPSLTTEALGLQVLASLSAFTVAWRPKGPRACTDILSTESSLWPLPLCLYSSV